MIIIFDYSVNIVNNIVNNGTARISFLISTKFRVNEPSRFIMYISGKMPIHHACEGGFLPTIKMLMDMGSSLQDSDFYGMNIFGYINNFD